MAAAAELGQGWEIVGNDDFQLAVTVKIPQQNWGGKLAPLDVGVIDLGRSEAVAVTLYIIHRLRYIFCGQGQFKVVFGAAEVVIAFPDRMTIYVH